MNYCIDNKLKTKILNLEEKSLQFKNNNKFMTDSQCLDLILEIMPLIIEIAEDLYMYGDLEIDAVNIINRFLEGIVELSFIKRTEVILTLSHIATELLVYVYIYDFNLFDKSLRADFIDNLNYNYHKILKLKYIITKL